MKRPLAVFGFAVLVCMLVVLRLAAVALLVVAVCAAAGMLVLFFQRKKRGGAHRAGGAVLLVLAAVLLAAGLRAGYDAVVVRPVQRLAGSEALAEALVIDVEPGYGPDTVHVTLKVHALDGVSCRPFRVQVRGMEEVRIGDVLSLRLWFSEYATTSAQTYGYAKGFYVAAAARGTPVQKGSAPDFLCRMRLAQYAAGDSIREKLPPRLSSVVAAMTVGDKRYLSDETVLDFRMAGLSHMLVVSGLHMAVVSGVVYTLLKKLLRREKAASAGALVFVLLFMAFTGFTPSVVRSGVMFLLVFSAALFARKADIYTSMGLAALLLCLQNPYAAADVGLQLSFAATLGALAAGEINRRRRQSRAQKTGEVKKKQALPRRALHRLATGAADAGLVSLAVSFAILPVLCLSGMGISLATVPMNILATPLLAPIVLAGFIMIIPAAVPVLGWFTRVAALVGGALTAFLEWLTARCAQIPGVWLPLGGAFSLAVVAGMYLLVFLAWKNRQAARRTLAYGLCAALLLPLALGLHLGLSRSTVTVLTAGGANPSVVIIRDRQAAVLYRGLPTDAAIQRIFSERNLKECVLWVDLRRTASSDEYLRHYDPAAAVIAWEDIFVEAVYTPFDEVDIYLRRQANGCVACIDIGGYKIGLASGRVNLAPYARLDLLIAGQGEAAGGYGALLVAGPAPDWAATDATLLQSNGQAAIVVRPGGGVRFWEVQDGIDTG